LKICDLHVAPRSLRDAYEIANELHSMGFSCVAVDNPDPHKASELAKPFREAGLETYTRITIEAEKWQKALKNIRRAVLTHDLIIVKPRNAEVARYAARDPRVALVYLPPGMARYMDKSQAHLLREGGSGVEVCLRPVLYGDDPRRTMRGLMIISRRAAAYEARLVVTSGARSKWEIWHYASMRAVLVSFGLPENIAKLAVTGYPASIVFSKKPRV
jgi:ribonuclease P/MRP protein subunit RPP1